MKYQIKDINDFTKNYELNLKKIESEIRKSKAKSVLLQFPDGLKPYSTVISEEIEKKAGCDVFIWLGDCFGACDVPLDVEKLGVDLIIQFGHSEWAKKDIKTI